MQRAYDEGLVVQLKPGAVPQCLVWPKPDLQKQGLHSWNEILAERGCA